MINSELSKIILAGAKKLGLKSDFIFKNRIF
jgi:hypothetical protein